MTIKNPFSQLKSIVNLSFQDNTSSQYITCQAVTLGDGRIQITASTPGGTSYHTTLTATEFNSNNIAIIAIGSGGREMARGYVTTMPQYGIQLMVTPTSWENVTLWVYVQSKTKQSGKIKDLLPNSEMTFGGREWYLFDPSTGYIFPKTTVTSRRFADVGASNTSVFSLEDTNIGGYLNTTFLNTLSSQEQKIVQLYDWDIKSDLTVSAKVGLISNTEWNTYKSKIPMPSPNFWIRTSLNASYPAYVAGGGEITWGGTNAYNVYPTMHLDANTMIINGEIVYNATPTVMLNTSNNQTLYENDTFTIDGTVLETNVGDTVTLRYQIGAGTVRAIKAFLSTGALEAFGKQLTFKSGNLYDGETLIASNLTDGVAHKLKVWATDDQGGQSVIVERDFYVVPNRAPSLTVEPPVISGNIDNDKFTVNGSYNDADGNTTTVKYRVNGSNSVQVASGTGGAFDFEVSFAQLVKGPNSIVIEAIDSYGAKTSKTIKLNKNVVETAQLKSTARYKILPPNKSAQAVLLWIERDKNLAIEVAVSMTMAGEAESFAPVSVLESVPIAAGSNTYEDTYFYEADAPKDNILVQIDMTRQSVDADDNITLISGVLE